MSVDGEQKGGSSNDPKTLAKVILWPLGSDPCPTYFGFYSSVKPPTSQLLLTGLANSPCAQNLHDLLHTMWPSNSIPRL